MQVWTDYSPTGPAAEHLRAHLAPHSLLFKDQGGLLGDADIALGQPDPAAILAAQRIKWLHITSAGYTKFDFPLFWQTLRGRATVVTNSSSVFAEPCAQHALAMILAFARGLPWSVQYQFPANAAPTWQSGPIRQRSFLLCDQKILLVGYGAIARRLVQLLAPMTTNIVGLRRQAPQNESIRIVTPADSALQLGVADHIVNTLPESSTTLNFFDAHRFVLLKPGAFFYNIGRGKTVDQAALIQALTSHHLGAAYLDVTDPEPLPPNHPLWTTPNCFITPHSAGGHQNERARVLDHFLQNLHHFEAGRPVADRIV